MSGFDWVGGSATVRALRAACRANGWTPQDVGPAAVALDLRLGDARFTAVATAEDRRVLVGVPSRAVFAPERFPPALRAALDARSDDLPAGLGWVVKDGPRGSYAVAMAEVPTAELDAARLRRAVGEVRAEVERLDDGLRERGLTP